MIEDKKLRVWRVPQVPMESFYVPVKSEEEGKRVLDLLAAYDAFQLQNKVKPDYCNMGGLQVWDEDEDEQEWRDWFLETEDDYFDDVDEYFEQCGNSEEIASFTKELFEQIDWEKIEQMTK